MSICIWGVRWEWLTWKSSHNAICSICGPLFPQPAAKASPWNLQEIQLLGPNSDPLPHTFCLWGRGNHLNFKKHASWRSSTDVRELPEVDRADQRAEIRVRVEATETVSHPYFSHFLFTKVMRKSYFFTLKSQGLQGTEKQDGSNSGILSYISSWPPASLTRCLCPSPAQVHLR